MRRLFRWTFNFVSLLSLVLGVGVCVPWAAGWLAPALVVGRSWPATFAGKYAEGRFVSRAYRGLVGVECQADTLRPVLRAGPVLHRFVPAEWLDFVPVLPGDQGPGAARRMGLGLSWGAVKAPPRPFGGDPSGNPLGPRPSAPVVGWSFRAHAPAWVLALVLAALPAIQARGQGRRRKARRRMRRGLCSSCGYDLTGNLSGTCPECGATVGGAKA